MTLLLRDTFNEANATDLADHTGDSGAGWAPQPDYQGTLRILAAAAKTLFSNPSDLEEALLVSLAAAPPASWQLKAQFMASGVAGETTAGGSMTMTVCGTSGTGSITVLTESGNSVVGVNASGTYTGPVSSSIVATGNTTTDATNLATSINANTTGGFAHGFSATSAGNVVTITAPAGAIYNGTTFSLGWAPGTATFSQVAVSGGTSGAINTLTVNGVNLIPSGAVSLSGASLTANAALVAAAVNAQSSSPRYVASSSGGQVFLFASPGAGATPNGFVVNSTVTSVTRTHTNVSGGAYTTFDNRVGICWNVQPGKKTFYRLREIGTTGTVWALEKVTDGAIVQLASVTGGGSTIPRNFGNRGVTVMTQYTGGVHSITFTEGVANTSATLSYTDATPLAAGAFGIWGSSGGGVTGSPPSQSPTTGLQLYAATQGLEIGTNDVAITLPVIQFAATGTGGGGIGSGATGTGDNTLPLLTLVAQADTSGASSTLPLLTLSAQAAFLTYTMESLPLLTAAATVLTGTTVVETLPSLDMAATLTSGNVMTVGETLPALTVIADTGSGVVEVLPVTTLTAAVANGGIATVDEVLLALAVDATLVPGYFISVDQPLPLLLLDSTEIPSGINTLAEQLPLLSLSAAMVTGNAATLLEVLPLLQSAAIANAVSANTAANTLPVLQSFAEAVQTVTESLATSQAWVVNLRTNALSEYTNFAFNSMTFFNGKYIAASDAGIVEIGVQAKNDDTTAIAAVLREGASDSESSFLKRTPYMYIQCATDGDMIVSTITSEYGRHDYLLAWNGSTALTQRRAKLGRGVKSAFFQFEFANRNGSSFRIRSHDNMARRSARRMQ